jgi:2'-hydroxyisoflavone reductase
MKGDGVRLLLIGGTSFVGRAISLAGLASGHEVTVLNRGQTPSDLPAEIERLVGDREGDLSALAGRSFDATIDVIAYRPGDVARLHDAIGDRGGHHVQISSVSAYADPATVGATEATAFLWPQGLAAPDAAITGETYGPLKADCEREAIARFGESTTIVRPTYVIGGHDVTLRFPYWVERCRRGGTVAVPGPREVALQYIDARDLAEFTVRLADEATAGAFTAAGPWPAARFVDVVEQIAQQVGPAGTSVVEVSPEVVEREGLAGKFPLWSGPTSELVMELDPSVAMAAGLTLRPLAESVDDIVEWWQDRPWPGHWLSGEEEATLLADET